tara:strand:+ start:24881 stop:25327 length:447 start_codon:yes stop_codon:yes gene_type:complete
MGETALSGAAKPQHAIFPPRGSDNAQVGELGRINHPDGRMVSTELSLTYPLSETTGGEGWQVIPYLVRGNEDLAAAIQKSGIPDDNDPRWRKWKANAIARMNARVSSGSIRPPVHKTLDEADSLQHRKAGTIIREQTMDHFERADRGA